MGNRATEDEAVNEFAQFFLSREVGKIHVPLKVSDVTRKCLVEAGVHPYIERRQDGSQTLNIGGKAYPIENKGTWVIKVDETDYPLGQEIHSLTEGLAKLALNLPLATTPPL